MPMTIFGVVMLLTIPLLLWPQLIDEFQIYRLILYPPFIVLTLFVCSALTMRYFVKCHWMGYFFVPGSFVALYIIPVFDMCLDYRRNNLLSEDKVETIAVVEKKYEKRINTRIGYVFHHRIVVISIPFSRDKGIVRTDINLERDESIYSTMVESDTIIIQYAVANAYYHNVVNWHPTTDEIKELSTPRHFINNQLQPIKPYSSYSLEFIDSLLQHSHVQVGTVFGKKEDEYYRHLVNVGIDSLHTTTHEFITTDRLYTKVYKRLNIGDKVILQVSDSLPEINRVIDWQPTEAELEHYQQPQPFNEKMIVKDYSRCTKEFEIENLHKSHKRIGIIFDKYEDDYVGAYLEVGIDDKHTRAHLSHTYDKKAMDIYNGASVGDTVLVRVSDALPQLNRVLNWQPTPEEKEKYKTPVKLIE